MVVLNRRPVFSFSYDSGKTWRIVDAETNNVARNENGDYSDGGGFTSSLICAAHAHRINFSRGCSSDEAASAQRAYRSFAVSGQPPAKMPLADAAPERATATTSETPNCHVTLLQMAGIVNRNKRTLERLASKSSFPTPAVEGGGGKPHEWRWADMRPILEAEYGRSLPEVFPADRFVQR